MKLRTVGRPQCLLFGSSVKAEVVAVSALDSSTCPHHLFLLLLLLLQLLLNFLLTFSRSPHPSF